MIGESTNMVRETGANFISLSDFEQVTPPLEQLAISGEFEASQILDRAGRSMFAGNPFGIVKRECPRAGWNREMCVENFARSFGCVQGNGYVRRRNGKNRQSQAECKHDCNRKTAESGHQ